MKYQVIISNVGEVYHGTSEVQANTIYQDYKAQSQSGVGKVAGEDVTLFENGEPIKEFQGVGHFL